MEFGVLKKKEKKGNNFGNSLKFVSINDLNFVGWNFQFHTRGKCVSLVIIRTKTNSNLTAHRDNYFFSRYPLSSRDKYNIEYEYYIFNERFYVQDLINLIKLRDFRVSFIN